jgi:beta-galactosidase
MHIGNQWEAKNAGITVTTPTISSANAIIRVVTTVKNEYKSSQSSTVNVSILDANNNVVTTMTSTQTIAASSSATFTLTSSAISSPHLWSLSDPYLYKAYVSVNKSSAPVDGKFQKFGMRWYSFNTTSGFYLNGQSIKIIGTNRHSAMAFVGGAIPPRAHAREAAQMKAAGFNLVRCCHYPHEPAFLDALDSLGLLAIEEGPTWAPGTGANVHTTNTTWLNNLLSSFTNMVRRDINHPSIILWNTCINHGGCYAALRDIAIAEDPGRLKGQCDVGLPMCYNMNGNESVTTGGGLCLEYIGFRDPIARFDNEAAQLTNTQWHIRMVSLARKTPANSGILGWEMYDNNSFHASGYTGATYPGTYNAANHGIVYQGLADLYRIPKIPFYWYISELTATPMVHIANYWTSSSPVSKITVFSNCDSVELFVNNTKLSKNGPATGDSIGSCLHPPFYFTGATYTAGSLRAIGYKNNVAVAYDTARTPGTATKLMIETDADTLYADGADFARLTVSVCDANGTTLPTATNAITATATGSGSVISPSPINAEAGKIIFLVQAGTSAGTVTVTTASGALTGQKTIKVLSASTAIHNGAQQNSSFSVGLNARTASFAGDRFVVPASWSKNSSMIEIYDVKGRVLVRTSTKDKKIIDLTKVNKASGVFFVRMTELNK